MSTFSMKEDMVSTADVGPVPSASNRRAWTMLGLALVVLYIVATLFPVGDLWGLHALGFLPKWVGLIGCAVAVAQFWPPIQRLVGRVANAASNRLSQGTVSGNVWLSGMCLVAFVIFYVLAMRTDIYGDSRTILFWGSSDAKTALEHVGELFDIHLLSSREVLTLLLHRVLAHVLHLPIRVVYRVVSALSGVVVLALWTLYFRQAQFARHRALLLMACGMLGANQLYYGHVETYPFAAVLLCAALLSGALVLDGRLPLWVPSIALVLAVKAHPIALCLVPPLMFVAVERLAVSRPPIRRFMHWPGICVWLIVPSLTVALLLYLFYFKSFHEPYATLGREFEHSFLPIVPAAPPLDRYCLQSFNHLVDFGNVLMLVGPPALAGVIGLASIHRRRIPWSEPRLIYAILAFAYPLLFLFALNPGLSMPRDWDIYAMVGGPLLLLFAALLTHCTVDVPSGAIQGTVVSCGVFTLAAIVLNVCPASLSERLEVVGEHVFKTYHAGASYIINVAQGMESEPTRNLARRVATIERLRRFKVGEDVEYSHLMSVAADSCARGGDLAGAIKLMEAASAVTPHDDNMSLWLVDAYLRGKRLGDAQAAIARILAHDPRNTNALVQGAIAAAMNNDFRTAVGYLERARELSPGDAQIRAWLRNMQAKAAHEPLLVR